MPESFTDYLFKNMPAMYRETGKQSHVYGLVSLMGDVLQGAEDEIDGIHNLLNPQKTRVEFLDWLASWVALGLDDTWSETKRRRLISRIVELYKLRGTVEGIKTFVEIYTDIRPEIIEPFSQGWIVGLRSTIGVDTKVFELREAPAHCFWVKVNSFEELLPKQKEKVMAVVDLQKPAHTKVLGYEWSASFWQVGARSTIGVDTKVGG